MNHPSPPQARARLVGFADDGADWTQIFVHGYEGVRGEQDLRQLAAQIQAARPRGACYLLCWGGWLPLPRDDRVVQRLGDAAVTVAEDVSAGRHEAWVQGVGVAAWETLRFWSHAGEADQVGAGLPELLKEVPLRGELVLWGHSLGARVLLAALSASVWQGAAAHAVLMAAAAEAQPPRWQQAARSVRGRLVNVYSSLDLVLRLAPLWSPLAGLREVDCQQVQNYELPLQHDQYWLRLPAIMDRLLPGLRAD